MKKENRDTVFFATENRSKIVYSKVNLLWQAFLLLLGITTLFLSGIGMMGDIFPKLTEGAEKGKEYLPFLFFCFLLYECIVPIPERFIKKRKYLYRFLIVLMGLWPLGKYISRVYWSDGEMVLAGLATYGQVYFENVNSYYKTNFQIGYLGEADMECFSKGLYTLWIQVGFLFSYLTGKKRVWAVFPAGVMILLLLVGYSPQYTQVALFLMGISSMGLYRRIALKTQEGVIWGQREETGKKGGIPIPTGVVLVFLLLLFNYIPPIFQPSLENLIDKSSDLEEYQKKLEESVTQAVWSIPQVALLESNHKIDNRKPVFTEKKIATIIMQKRPEGQLYFRNFLGMTYKNGSWYYEKDLLQKEAKEDEIDPEELRKTLSECIFRLVNKNRRGEYLKSRGIQVVDYSLVYKKATGKYALQPYFTEWLQELEYTTDVLIKRGNGQKELNLRGIDRNTFSEADLMWLQESQLTQNRQTEDIWDFYDSYVMEHFLSQSDSVPSAKKLAKEKRYGNYVDSDWGRNRWRLENAMMVSQYLQNFEYNQELDAIHDGTDSVEYMLSNSREGYCVHFATAGTLILRGMGVPARYVSGYVVSPSDFEKNEDGDYEYTIIDKKGHAWVEVYLDHLGWIPIEMTPGYGDSLSGFEQRNPWTEEVKNEEENREEDQALEDKEEVWFPFEEEPKEEEELTSKEEDLPEEMSTEEVTKEEQGISKPSSEVQQTQKPEDIVNSDDKEDAYNYPGGEVFEGKEGEGNIGEWVGILLKSFFVVVFLILMFFVGLFLYRIEQRYQSRVYRLMRRKKYKSAVQQMHRDRYRKLRRRGKIWRGNPTDAEVLQALKEDDKEILPEEWDRYMDIVKEAYFGGHEIREDQAQYCIELQRRQNNGPRHTKYYLQK